MRTFLLACALLAMSFAGAMGGKTDPGALGQSPTIASPVPSKAASPMLRLTQTDGCSGNACGLCTDTDCCGGASLGWKLCQSDCGSDSSGTQQYKCCMVSECP